MEGFFFGLAIAAVVGLVSFVVSRWDVSYWRSVLGPTARRLGIRHGSARLRPRAWAEGVVRGFHLRIDVWKQAEPNSRTVMYTRITVENRLPGGLELRARHHGLGRPSPSEVRLGDPDFDRTVVVKTDNEAGLLARLDPAQRETVARLVGQGATFQNRTITFEMARSVDSTPSLVTLCSELLDLAEALAAPVGSVPDRLRSRVENDPIEAVRVRSLELLSTAFEGSVEALAGIESGLNDESARVRIVAVEAAGERGLQVAVTLAVDVRVATEVRVRALESLGRHAKASEQVLSGLDEILHREIDDEEILVAALRASEAIGFWPALDLLDGFLDRPHMALRAEAAHQLGRYALPEVEPRLLELLDGEPEPLRVAAVRSLAENGTVRAVAPLRRVAEALPRRSQLRSEAERAIHAIRTRVGQVEPGRLSVLPQPQSAGGLTVSREAGGLTQADPDHDPGESAETESAETESDVLR